MNISNASHNMNYLDPTLLQDPACIHDPACREESNPHSGPNLITDTNLFE